MNTPSSPVIFFGSGPVAAQSLQKLLQWHPVTAVVTKHTPPHHKESAPVELFASTNSLPIFYADTKSELDALVLEKKLPSTQYGIVIDYGVIISKAVIEAFPLGILNSHFSILPEWRGADPITFSLLSGQSSTGVSIMLIDEGMDTGQLLSIDHYDILPTDTNVTLTNALIALSDNLLQRTIPAYTSGDLKPYNQPDAPITYSQKLTKQSGILNPNKTATELEREVRAFAGWPNSRLQQKDFWMTIKSAEISDDVTDFGVLKLIDGQIHYGCKNGSIVINSLQPAGKKNMSASAFCNGYAHIIT